MPVNTADTEDEALENIARVLSANSRPVAVVGDMEDVQARYDEFLELARQLLRKDGDDPLTIRASDDERQVLFFRNDTYLPDLNLDED